MARYSMDRVSVRYIVADTAAARDFYERLLGFELKMQKDPGFAMLEKGGLRLLLNAPGAGGAGQAMPDGRLPEPGGWNRLIIEVDDLDKTVATLRAAGARFRNEIVEGVGGRQLVVEDPSGNAIELL